MSVIAYAVLALSTAAPGGPFIETQPFVGSLPPSGCVISVDGAESTVYAETSDSGVVCKLPVGNINDGFHVARARYIIGGMRGGTLGEWSKPLGFWTGRIGGVSVWTWDKAILCDGGSCSEEK